jgi:hypothetical protein
MRSVALREACGVVTHPSFGAGKGVPSLSKSGRRPWKRRRAWRRSREELPGVWGAERIDGDGGNWGGPPRPGSLRVSAAGAWRPVTGDPGKWIAGRTGVGGGRSTA